MQTTLDRLIVQQGPGFRVYGVAPAFDLRWSSGACLRSRGDSPPQEGEKIVMFAACIDHSAKLREFCSYLEIGRRAAFVDSFANFPVQGH